MTEVGELFDMIKELDGDDQVRTLDEVAVAWPRPTHFDNKGRRQNSAVLSGTAGLKTTGVISAEDTWPSDYVGFTDNAHERVGELKLSIEVLPLELAQRREAGEGRKEPHPGWAAHDAAAMGGGAGGGACMLTV